MTDTYNVYWTWNDKYDSQANWQQTVIRAESQKDAEQRAFEYMQDVWTESYDSLQDLVNECFASFMVTPDDDAENYIFLHMHKYWLGKWECPMENTMRPVIDALTAQGYFDDNLDGHYTGK